MKNMFKKAHEMTRKMKESYPEVDYQTQFGLCLSYLFEEEKEEEKVDTKGYGARINLGKVDLTVDVGYTKIIKGFTEIVKETEKAVKINFKGKITVIDEDYDNEIIEEEERDMDIWLPKSQIAITKDFIYMASWLQNEKGLRHFQVHSSFHDGVEVF